MPKGFVVVVCSLAVIAAAAALADEDYSAWPLLRRSFPSTGGGGVVIGEYDPVIEGDRCRTAFTATLPDGQVFRNVAEFRAVPAPGGTLCTDGRWHAQDGGGASGTTPFRVFFGADGVRCGSP
ncbi:hypothetical protein GCM10009416_01010 [Craurococcus roseus]|uniref:Uncharacterized protein n=1 Tax=Craurococcus roseus TaxID=77585 RepID=A0ABP3PNA9_9PROT